MPAGRPVGSSTKNKQFLLNKLKEMYGDDFHPILKMAENCVTLQSIADKHKEGMISFGDSEDKSQGQSFITATSSATAAIAAWDKIAPYTEPKLKALEVSGPGEDGVITYEEVRRTIVHPEHTDS